MPALTEAQEWLLVLGVTVLQALYVAWCVIRWRAEDPLDREYEQLCRDLGGRR